MAAERDNSVLAVLKRREQSLAKRIADVEAAFEASQLETEGYLERTRAELDDVRASITKLEAD